MRKLFTKAIILVVLITLPAGCGPAAPTATPVLPTASPAPATSVPPTATPMPPMATAVPPAPTGTSLPPPTATPLPPPAVPSATSTPAPLLLLENSPQLFGRTETFQVGLGDLDGDGDLDAVLANMGANDSQVWFNDGAGQFIDSGQRLTQQGHGVALGDLDGDGDLDLFMTCADYGSSSGGWSKKPSRVYLNDGRGTFQDSGQDIGDTELSGNGVNLIDLDGDGDLDVHVIYYEVGGMADKVYLNDGTGRFSDSGLALQEEEIAWGDLDADGDVDILAKGYGEGYRVLLNDGAGQFAVGWQMEDSQAMIGGLALADLDGDGDLDALLANGFRSEGSYPTRLLWNDGAGQFTDSGQELNETMAARFAVGDLDRDGDLDLFVSNCYHRPGEVWLNDGAGRLTDSGLRLQSPSRRLATWPSLGDLDGDGDLDVVEAGFEGKAEVWLNETPFSAVPPRNASLGDTWTRPADGMVMVYVPAGELQMGSDDDEVGAALEMCQAYYVPPCERVWFENEQPVHPVVLDGFWLDPTEVTNAQYRRCVEAGACSSPRQSSSDTRQAYYGDSAYDDYPVVHVTWGQGDAYCRWAGGRLPTEAEWEWAARGPEGRRYPWGEEYDGTRLNSCDVNCGYEWAEDAFDDGYGDTAPVGSYPDGASWCGALDLAGNVWEWTADWYGEYSTERQSNPAGPSSGTSRALRGDAADGTRAVSRAAARHGMKPGRAYEYTGFRCVVSAQGLE